MNGPDAFSIMALAEQTARQREKQARRRGVLVVQSSRAVRAEQGAVDVPSARLARRASAWGALLPLAARCMATKAHRISFLASRFGFNREATRT